MHRVYEAQVIERQGEEDLDVPDPREHVDVVIERYANSANQRTRSMCIKRHPPTKRIGIRQARKA